MSKISEDLSKIKKALMAKELKDYKRKEIKKLKKELREKRLSAKVKGFMKAKTQFRGTVPRGSVVRLKKFHGDLLGGGFL